VIVYEVNLEVESRVAEAFAVWLPGHIGEMLALPGFLSAHLHEVIDHEDDGRRRWSVRYSLNAEEDLDGYLDGYAHQMRGDGLARFGKNFSATRRVLRSVGQFEPRPPSHV
jgi:hypothetical protein